MLDNIALQNKSIMILKLEKERDLSLLKNIANTGDFLLIKKRKVKSHLNKNLLQQLQSHFSDSLIECPPKQTTSARCLPYLFQLKFCSYCWKVNFELTRLCSSLGYGVSCL